MQCVVGLGNPGERYRRTRHNLGFMVLEALASQLSASPWRYQSDALVTTADLDGGHLVLVKPQTFMNRSGFAVAPVLLAHGIEPKDTLVVVDDIALDLGVLRLRERGGHGGHNGLRSIIETLGTEDFPRLRIGIRQGEVQGDLAEYVLAPFPEEEVLVVQEMVGTAVDALLSVRRDGTGMAMSRYNRPLKG
jgi:PTH1 family peptidyl-tRNA hydrolase